MVLYGPSTWQGLNREDWPFEWRRGTYTEGSRASVRSNEGQLAGRAGFEWLSYRANTQYAYYNAVTEFAFRFVQGDVIAGAALRADDTIRNQDGYYLEWQQNGTVNLFRVVNGNRTQIANTTSGVAFNMNTLYRAKFGIVGNELRAKFWQGATEPTTWTLTFTDTEEYAMSGACGLYARGGAQDGAVRFDNYLIREGF